MDLNRVFRDEWQGDLPPMAILQHPWEFKQLLAEFNRVKPKTVLEIGNWTGGTLWYWLRNSGPDTKIVSLDLQPQPKGTEDPRHVHIQGDSRESKNLVTRELPELDFLFIDGDHSFLTARLDFINYAPLVRPGGIIALHDIDRVGWRHGNPTDPGTHAVYALWDRIQMAGFLTRRYSAIGDIIGTGIVYAEDDLCTRIKGL